MARVRIRQAKSSDCGPLAELRYQFRAEAGLAKESKSRFVRRCTSWMKKRFRSGASRWRCWVLDNGETLLGHVCVQLFEKVPNPVNNEPEGHAYITNFYIVSEMRNRGLGQGLMNKALSWCKGQDVDAVILWATPASKSLYRRCGFIKPDTIFELPHRSDI
jgi:N-acetylglutamate synthase-like GNAT family acetyltransferase